MSIFTHSSRSTPELAALREYAATRDPRAFETLVHRYQGMVLATCRRVLGSTADAMEATQETFFKLATSAGKIRSHPAAWLHRAAVGTSIDMVRARASRRRVESAAAGDDGGRDAAEQTDPTWREIKPVFDRAMAELTDGERDLIVTRFLLGRSQVEMAAEAGCAPGTMSRRIDAALGSLRRGLAAHGVKAGAPAALGAALVAGAGPVEEATASTLTPRLMEIGLAARGAPVAAVPAAALWVAGALGLAAMGIASWTMLSRGPAALVTSVASEAPAATRPTRPQPPLLMRVNLLDGRPNATMTIDGNTLTIATTESDPVWRRTHIVDLLSADSASEPKMLKARLRTVKVPAGEGSDMMPLIGKEIDIKVRLEGDVLRLEPQIGPPEMPNAGMVLRGVRRAAGTAEDSVVPTLQGTYDAVDEWRLTMGPEVIQIDAAWGVVRKFRILEWTTEGDVARVQAICSGGQLDAQMTGKRVKLLVRKDAEGWTIAQHNAFSPKLNEWPAALESAAGSAVHLCVFATEGGK
jgi:RNA polymerase sigma factor (sigma-70 family)